MEQEKNCNKIRCYWNGEINQGNCKCNLNKNGDKKWVEQEIKGEKRWHKGK